LTKYEQELVALLEHVVSRINKAQSLSDLYVDSHLIASVIGKEQLANKGIFTHDELERYRLTMLGTRVKPLRQKPQNRANSTDKFLDEISA
jgi:transcriptional regulator of aromatic amino acid metabolism